MANSADRSAAHPSATLAFGHDVNSRQWMHERKGSNKLTLQEAAVLQTFPADFPFEGTKGKQFLQVGNAIPPLLAHAILGALTKDA
jgi:DNA (cytosine-5)-methyltransferase 1